MITEKDMSHDGYVLTEKEIVALMNKTELPRETILGANFTERQMKEVMEFGFIPYDLTYILSKECTINMIMGERSNAKTGAVLAYAIQQFYENGDKTILIRRREENLKGYKWKSIFSNFNKVKSILVDGNKIEELTEGEYNTVVTRMKMGRSYHLAYEDPQTGKLTVCEEEFMRPMAISTWENDKGFSISGVKTIFFDEFLTKSGELPDEVSQFLNAVSTCVRANADTKIIMVANTVSWESVYFDSMGIRDVRKMKQGELATFSIEEEMKTGRRLQLKIAVHLCEDSQIYGGKPSDVLFLMDKKAFSMITSGEFEVSKFPNCPHNFTNKDVRVTYWVATKDYTIDELYDKNTPSEKDIGLLKMRLIAKNKDRFLYVEQVNKGRYLLERGERDFMYSTTFSSNPRHFSDPCARVGKKAVDKASELIRFNRIFFEDSVVGENFRHYCKKANSTNLFTI